jgi:hypothetical protein
VHDWQHWIDKAFLAGWRVRWCDDVAGHVIVSPARPRHPSVTLGHYTDERAAWRGAANLAKRNNCMEASHTILSG